MKAVSSTMATRRSKRIETNGLLSIETENIVQRALQQHQEKKSEQRKRGGKSAGKEAKSARSASKGPSQKESRAPSRMPEKNQPIYSQSRKAKSVAVSRKPSKSPTRGSKPAEKPFNLDQMQMANKYYHQLLEDDNVSMTESEEDE